MRKSGILMHITSLPSDYGVGGLGKAAYEFVDFLEKSGQRLWQVLPLGQTSYKDSPYQTYSSYAGNPYMIDLDMLCDAGLLEKSDLKRVEEKSYSVRVDYGKLYETRLPLLKKAAEKFAEKPDSDYYTFLEENRGSIDDYASFMAIKEKNGFRSRETWDLKMRTKNENSVACTDGEILQQYKVIQYFFFSQWFKLKKYANERDIEIIGDLPIYCASDSCDVWCEPKAFVLDENYLPKKVAGVPPDGFSPLGQRWGNPLYDWMNIEKNGFSIWVEKMKFALKMFDIVRIDHFRGFDSYYAIDVIEKDAAHGKWLEGPKMKLFKAFDREIGKNLPIIAEDLGYLTDSVRALLASCGYPGMKILQFAFDDREESDYLPHNYDKNSVCYVGTHDNDTALGWFESCDDSVKKKAVEYLNLTEDETISYGLIRGAMMSVSDYVIICMQDWLCEGSEGRMNTPATDDGNWQWRMDKNALTEELANRIKHMTTLYGR